MDKINVEVGLDISTKTVGVCLLEHKTNKLIKLFYIKLSSKKLENFYDKVDYTVNFLEKEIDYNQYNVVNIYVEEIAKKFTAGLSNASTIIILAQFNGVISNEVRKLFHVIPKMINVKSARKALSIKIDQKDKSKSTKEKVFDKVLTFNPSFPWEQYVPTSGKNKGKLVFSKENQDMADAWVIVRSGKLLS